MNIFEGIVERIILENSTQVNRLIGVPLRRHVDSPGGKKSISPHIIYVLQVHFFIFSIQVKSCIYSFNRSFNAGSCIGITLY